jgi:mannose-6-phosphate isomerase-like protein (cupin superfamily)
MPARIVDFSAIDPVECSCGQARRGLLDAAEVPFSLHRTEISVEARLHYHRGLTETYYVVECGIAARMELDGETIALHPGRCIVIPPGVRHRALGEMTVLIVVYPKFDPADEWFD